MRESTKERATRLLQSFVEDKPASIDELDWCWRYLKCHARGLSPEDLDDLVHDVLIEVLAVSRGGGAVEPDELLDAFVVTGNRLRQQRKRELRRQREKREAFDHISNYLSDGSSVEGELVFSQMYDRFQSHMFEALESEIPKLSDSDHDTISRGLGLERHYPPKSSSAPSRKPEAERKAKYRAKCRLRDGIERFLTDRLDVLKQAEASAEREVRSDEKLILELALLFVSKGDGFINVFQ